MNIVFTITRKEYEDIVGMISGYCCPCADRNGHCAEIECDVQMICEILWDYMERNEIKFEKEPGIECSSREVDISCDEDKFPFKV